MFSNSETQKILDIATYGRNMLEHKYGNKSENMMGKCIEATDTLVKIYKQQGFNAVAKQVWCLYEYFESCSDYCFEEHWIVVIEKGKDKKYVDITMDQFQWAFSKKLPRVYMYSKLPNFYLSRKPGKVTLDKCGWNDWYNYGNYINNFNYWN